MFDLSLAEMILILVVAVIFIGPKDVPVVIRAVVRAVRRVRGLYDELRAAFADLAKESGVQEFNANMRMIRGDDGRLYEAYDFSKGDDSMTR